MPAPPQALPAGQPTRSCPARASALSWQHLNRCCLELELGWRVMPSCNKHARQCRMQLLIKASTGLHRATVHPAPPPHHTEAA